MTTTNPATATEPSGDARQMAATLWDHFRALMQQGFTEPQALTLLGTMMGSAIAGNQRDKDGQR